MRGCRSVLFVPVIKEVFGPSAGRQRHGVGFAARDLPGGRRRLAVDCRVRRGYSQAAVPGDGTPGTQRRSRLATNEARRANSNAIQREVTNWVAARQRADVLNILDDFEVVSAPVNNARDIATDPHFPERTLVGLASCEILDWRSCRASSAHGLLPGDRPTAVCPP